MRVIVRFFFYFIADSKVTSWMSESMSEIVVKIDEFTNLEAILT